MSDLTHIIAGCINNDQRSQIAFYNAYQPLIRGFILKRMQSDEFLDEIVSMTFERAFAKMTLYKATGTIEGWLLTIVRHCMYEVIENINKQKNSFLRFPENFDYIAEVNEIYFHDSSSELHANELTESIKGILPKSEYAVFMAYFEGYTHKEIAEKLNLSEGTSKWYLHQARKKIQEKIASGHLVI